MNKRLRIRKKRRTDAGSHIPGRLLRVMAAAVLAPAAVLALYAALPAVSEAARRAALLSATIAMPDSGLALFEERFRDEIRGEESLPTLPQSPSLSPGVSAPEPRIDVPPQNPIVSAPDKAPSSSSPAPAPVRIPKIPEKYAAPLLSENFAGTTGGTLIQYEAGFLKNDTKYTNEEVEEILGEHLSLRFEDDGGPQVLIVHTHATESFETYDNDVYDTRNNWRSTDNHQNMVAVGGVMRETLESYGIGVLHDTTQHDYPSYNGSYERSAETILAYLEEYPSIKVVLDLHRDAMARDDAIIKPVSVIDGKKAAQIMIIAGCDDGKMNMPLWRENLRFAAAFQSYMGQEYPELTRPVYFCYRKYNMDLTTGSLLLEFGSNANTLEEASYSAELAGHALARLILDYTDPVME